MLDSESRSKAEEQMRWGLWERFISLTCSSFPFMLLSNHLILSFLRLLFLCKHCPYYPPPILVPCFSSLLIVFSLLFQSFFSLNSSFVSFRLLILLSTVPYFPSSCTPTPLPSCSILTEEVCILLKHWLMNH